MKENQQTGHSRSISLSVSEKYMLTLNETAAYFNIGTKKMRLLAQDNTDTFAVMIGKRYLIIRTKFEEYIDSLLEGKEEQPL